MIGNKFYLNKKFFIFVFVFSFLFFSPAFAKEFKFDFQPTGSPIEIGFIEINKNTLYSSLIGYGWDTSPANDADRATGSDLERDFVYDSTDREFKVDLPNGKYNVTVLLGDKGAFAHDNMDVSAETVLKLSGVNTATGEVKQLSFTVDLSDGQLNILFQDVGGADPNWVS